MDRKILSSYAIWAYLFIGIVFLPIPSTAQQASITMEPETNRSARGVVREDLEYLPDRAPPKICLARCALREDCMAYTYEDRGAGDNWCFIKTEAPFLPTYEPRWTFPPTVPFRTMNRYSGVKIGFDNTLSFVIRPDEPGINRLGNDLGPIIHDRYIPCGVPHVVDTINDSCFIQVDDEMRNDWREWCRDSANNNCNIADDLNFSEPLKIDFCIAECAREPLCLAYTYVNNQCYLKNRLGNPVRGEPSIGGTYYSGTKQFIYPPSWFTSAHNQMPIYRVQVYLETAETVSDASLDEQYGLVGIHARNPDESVYIDSSWNDFNSGQGMLFDVPVWDFQTLGDLNRLTLFNLDERILTFLRTPIQDGWCMRIFGLFVNEELIFSRSFGDSDCKWLSRGQTYHEFGAGLGGHPAWQNYRGSASFFPIGSSERTITLGDLRNRIEGYVGYWTASVDELVWADEGNGVSVSLNISPGNAGQLPLRWINVDYELGWRLRDPIIGNRWPTVPVDWRSDMYIDCEEYERPSGERRLRLVAKTSTHQSDPLRMGIPPDVRGQLRDAQQVIFGMTIPLGEVPRCPYVEVQEDRDLRFYYPSWMLWMIFPRVPDWNQ